jgi:hypothetical protein
MAQSKRKFYRTTITVTVLSENGPVDQGTPLEDISAEIDSGSCVGQVKIAKTEKLTGLQMARATHRLSSDPEFFQLDENGNDLD